MQKICAGIVTYHPQIRDLRKNILSIFKQVDKIIIVDNGSDNFDLISYCIAEISSKICILRNLKNAGIAKALNQLCEYAEKNGYNWILTLDQDTCCPEKLICEFLKYKADDVSIISPNIIYRHNESYADYSSRGIQEVDWTITSGSFTNIKAWRSVDGFDEKLFIDAVDRDFGIRVKRKGYRILKDYNIAIFHELGNLKCRKIFGRTIYVTNHSKIRKYYMTRNAIYLDKKLGIHYSAVYILKLVLKTLMFEEKKMSKLGAIMKGFSDGRKMRKSFEKQNNEK